MSLRVKTMVNITVKGLFSLFIIDQTHAWMYMYYHYYVKNDGMENVVRY